MSIIMCFTFNVEISTPMTDGWVHLRGIKTGLKCVGGKHGQCFRPMFSSVSTSGPRVRPTFFPPQCEPRKSSPIFVYKRLEKCMSSRSLPVFFRALSSQRPDFRPVFNFFSMDSRGYPSQYAIRICQHFPATRISQ